MLNDDAAIVTYRADANAVAKGKPFSLHEDVTSGWATRDGKWLNVSAIGFSAKAQRAKEKPRAAVTEGSRILVRRGRYVADRVR